MREWLANIIAAVFNRNIVTVSKGERVTMDKLNKFLSLLPNNPMAKVVNSTGNSNLVEFRLEMPKRRLSKISKRRAKRNRTWAGGRI